MPKQQRSRTPKKSAGINGGGGKGRPLTGIEKINISRHNVKQRVANLKAAAAKDAKK